MILNLVQIAVLVATAAGPEWPEFRGPAGNGVAAKANPPVEWSETKNVRWKVEITGCARSSPVVLGDRIWLTTAAPQDAKRTRIGSDDMQTTDRVTLGAICLDRATGKRVWQATLFEIDKPAPVHWLNSWATPTPAVEPGRLYCDFGAFGTVCLNSATGEVLWKQCLKVDHQVGPGSSPALCGNLLILVRDGRDVQFITALDKGTGQQVWKTDRPPIAGNNTEVKKSFATPLVVQHAGKTQIIAPAAHWVLSYDPASGKELWRARHGTGFSLAARPLFGHGLVYIATGCTGQQLVAVRVDGQGDVTDTHIAWQVKGGVPGMSSPILVGNEIYAVTDAGIASCLDAGTGSLVWRQRLGGTFLASPTWAAGRLYFISQDGKATVIEAGRQFVRIAENQLEGNVAASPAMVDRAIYLRTDSHLYCIETP